MYSDAGKQELANSNRGVYLKSFIPEETANAEHGIAISEKFSQTWEEMKRKFGERF